MAVVRIPQGVSRLACASVAVGIVFSATATPIALGESLSQKKSQIDAQLDDTYDEVQSRNKKVAKATQKLLSARSQLPEAEANLATAQAAQDEAAASAREASEEFEKATNEVLAAEEEMADLTKARTQLEGNVGDFARRAYQMGPMAELEMLLEAQDPSDFTDRLAAIRTISQANNTKLGEMSDSQADLRYSQDRLGALREKAEVQKQIADQRLAAAAQAKAGAAAAKALVDGLVAQEQAAVKSAQAHKDDIKAEYDALAAEQARISAQIAAAAKALAKNTGVKGGVPTGGGQWVFPVPNAAIGSEAGWRFHPILKYTRCHAGADIGASTGTPIYAVDGGVVIAASYAGGYGNYTTISHGGGLTSSYAHQSGMAVSVGDKVTRGQVIGFVGSTGLSSGPHLHFEARVGGQPYNPRGWLGSGAKVPVCV